MLHIVNKSPYQSNALDSCLRLARPGSALLLIEDGVYAATAGSAAQERVSAACAHLKVYALRPDMDARGLSAKALDGVTLVDYAGFVDLAAQYHTSQSWLWQRAPATHHFYLENNMSMEINGETIETDEEGYLINLADWTPDVAQQLAEEEKIALTDNHWEVVNFLREYYNEYQIAPAVRVLTKAIGKQFGEEKGNSKYLYELFPYGPAKQACKIAGLPKPTGCI